jgi:hypothetical protein
MYYGLGCQPFFAGEAFSGPLFGVIAFPRVIAFPLHNRPRFGTIAAQRLRFITPWKERNCNEENDGKANAGSTQEL